MKNPKIKPNFEIFYPNMSFDSVIFRSPVTEFEMKILNKDKFVRIIHLLNGEFSLEEISSEADVNLDELKKFLSYLEKYQVLEEETDVRKVTELLKPTFHKIKRRFNERNTPSFLVITLRGLDEIFHEIFREIKYGGIDIAVVDEDEIDINHYIKILKEKNPSFVICLLNSTYWDLCEKINRHLLTEGIRCIYAFEDGIVGPDVRSSKDSCLSCYIKRLEESRLVVPIKYLKIHELHKDLNVGNQKLTEIFKVLIDEIDSVMEGKGKLINKIIKIDEKNEKRTVNVIRKEACPFHGMKTSNKGMNPPKNAIIKLKNVIARYTENDLRVVPPQETLKAARPYIGEIGIITRVYKDKFGNYRAISSEPSSKKLLNSINFGFFPRIRIHGGKGVTEEQKKVSAIMEAFERYCGKYQGTEYEISGSYKKLKKYAVDPRRFVIGRTEFDNYSDDLEIKWTWGYSLTKSKAVLIPSVFVYLLYFNPDNCRFPHYDSNGLASGNCIEEAVLHGMLEVIERDSMYIVRKNRLCMPSIKVTEVDNPLLVRELKDIEKNKMEYYLKYLTLDINIPIVSAYLRGYNEYGEEIHSYSVGAHPDPQIAALRALTEARQLYHMNPFLDSKTDYMYKVCDKKINLRDIDDGLFTYNLKECIERCVKEIDRAGYEVLVVNLSRPEVPFPVVRVLIPGLQPLDWLEFPKKSARYREVPEKLGYKVNKMYLGLQAEYPISPYNGTNFVF